MREGLTIVGRYRHTFAALLRRTLFCRDSGFTITEVLIVLAVTGALFVSAVIMISGRQSQTAFSQAIRQAESQIQQVLNEVATGYFPSNGTFSCTTAGGPPILSTLVASNQGTNSGCIFLGKAIQFKIAGTDPEQYAIFTIAGLKQGAAGGNESTTLAEAKPMVVAPSSPSHNGASYPNLTDDRPLQNGLTVSRVWYRNGGADVDIGAIAFVNSLAQYGGSGQIVSGSGRVDVVALDGTVLNNSMLAMAETMNSDGGNKIATGTVNPTGGVFVCFESGGTKNYGIVQIGGTDRDTALTLTIKNNTGTPCTYP